ncbi:DUF7352 domain-containing protein [Micromonospora sp. NBC_00421]|uniref:DUF7352 domain-containing protein n=1 Tax=Micromonospora sp. NBC_00421 TaxID=2975976 RepID=UPI002E21E4BE
MTAPTDTARILRYEVPVNDRWNLTHLPGPIVHIASRNPGTVEVWATTDSFGPYHADLRVYGTGQPYPAASDIHHRGSTITADGRLVWHLMQRGPNQPSR